MYSVTELNREIRSRAMQRAGELLKLSDGILKAEEKDQKQEKAKRRAKRAKKPS